MLNCGGAVGLYCRWLGKREDFRRSLGEKEVWFLMLVRLDVFMVVVMGGGRVVEWVFRRKVNSKYDADWMDLIQY